MVYKETKLKQYLIDYEQRSFWSSDWSSCEPYRQWSTTKENALVEFGRHFQIVHELYVISVKEIEND